MKSFVNISMFDHLFWIHCCMFILEFPRWIWLLKCSNSMFPWIFFTLCTNTLFYDQPFNVGSNISTVIYALPSCLKYDPYVDTLISLT